LRFVLAQKAHAQMSHSDDIFYSGKNNVTSFGENSNSTLIVPTESALWACQCAEKLSL
jgi:hypothetical protein